MSGVKIYTSHRSQPGSHTWNPSAERWGPAEPQNYAVIQSSELGALEKWGGCPPDDGPCLQVTPDQCMHDRQCPSSMKCCSRACFRQCVPRVAVKLGKCPLDQLHCLSPIKHMCNQDSNCSGKKRCCLSACGRDCRDPSKG